MTHLWTWAHFVLRVLRLYGFCIMSQVYLEEWWEWLHVPFLCFLSSSGSSAFSSHPVVVDFGRNFSKLSRFSLSCCPRGWCLLMLLSSPFGLVAFVFLGPERGANNGVLVVFVFCRYVGVLVFAHPICLIKLGFSINQRYGEIILYHNHQWKLKGLNL